VSVHVIKTRRRVITAMDVVRQHPDLQVMAAEVAKFFVDVHTEADAHDAAEALLASLIDLERK
jgi:hypothetical protein